jgi:rhodanese-related sulfurtransferase
MGLTAVHADIVSDMPAVSHITSQEFAEMNNPLILDIREPNEYAVSRIAGAIWVPPTDTAEHALTQIGDVKGREIVVYCSVGRRSSIFANRVQSDLIARGAVSVSNLENGIFGWHNAEAPLTDATGETDVVHPYNNVWKRYVRRKDKAVYEPK